MSNFIWKEFMLRKILSKTDYKRILGPTAEALVREVNLADKTCLITGASGSIGLEITRCLSLRNCNVIMACRNVYKAKVLAKRNCEITERLTFYQINLTSLTSVKNCAEEILTKEKKIDIVILNAATFGLPWAITEDRLETIFQVNFLSQYYLLLCLGKILASDVRVIFTSSESHRNINWPSSPSFESVSLPKEKYTSIKAYNISKLCGLLLMHYLSNQWANSKKSVFCAHPGSFIKTGLCCNWWAYEALYTFMIPFCKSIKQGASTIVYCATSPELKGETAVYLNNCKRCDESDIAKDLRMSFKVHDLIINILRERTENFDEFIKDFSHVKSNVKNNNYCTSCIYQY
ncbi:WW domain-containing oxidoreductase-like [Vanessa tameamea]|uniref:WW domain-containing oxidoreductase-like n=1 Tax=Vanessa tameamea TaxID=334116 RepID=A0ABM4AYK3_VANTA